MNPGTSLKLSAIAFTVLWTGWMLWWGGSFERANVILLMICGIVAGYVWYRAMRWQFQRTGMLPRNEGPADPAAKR
ncbi:hypothetical protein KMZ29_06895 [Bradyrhizobium sediminis]|uniref:Uncharacterized protein n=1 Tax=Bradyrhizobium sediminis TaxID=2840469 RepID=A0A975NFX1_9BRAD|nr:hypothetical protein [Bradyrhizobium sediminis]QWG14393.1 hypothetical protein KMZ29_06895 [Bradyrhizobium sediminis]